MLDDVLPTEARDEVTALRFTCIHCHRAERRKKRGSKRTRDRKEATGDEGRGEERTKADVKRGQDTKERQSRG